MTLYIKVSFALVVLGLFCRLCFLGWSEYPRTVNYTRGEDVVLLVISMALASWGASLLWF